MLSAPRLLPHADVKAIRQALVTTPTTLMNCSMANHIPRHTDRAAAVQPTSRLIMLSTSPLSSAAVTVTARASATSHDRSSEPILLNSVSITKLNKLKLELTKVKNRIKLQLLGLFQKENKLKLQ